MENEDSMLMNAFSPGAIGRRQLVRGLGMAAAGVWAASAAQNRSAWAQSTVKSADRLYVFDCGQ